MGLKLSQLRTVYVVGIGLHPYQAPSAAPYQTLGLAAIREALSDAGLDWREVESSYVATARLGVASGRGMLKHLGAYGQPLVHIENASASGSAAFRHACIEVAAGISDVALAVGVDKCLDRPVAAQLPGAADLTCGGISPATHFALIASEYLAARNLRPEDLALTAVKNHRNGALNPYAQRARAVSVSDVLAARKIAGCLTALQCTPVGEGAAAVIVASADGIRRLNLDPGRAIRVAAAAANSESVETGDQADMAITARAIAGALAEAQISATELDIFELHDAFSIEELQYVEGAGVCRPGEYLPLLKEGAFDLNGRCAVSASGGLLSMGHPVGPTGIGQIAEITRQLRGEAGARQHAGARLGLAHMVGLGSVCYAHVLAK